MRKNQTGTNLIQSFLFIKGSENNELLKTVPTPQSDSFPKFLARITPAIASGSDQQRAAGKTAVPEAQFHNDNDLDEEFSLKTEMSEMKRICATKQKPLCFLRQLPPLIQGVGLFPSLA